ncbi:hypothetical protein LAUMK13_05703 [Mycobacterium innocens]|uniref:Uncharacterized protein n=1 Tax=Mycobacterium innocens TaxID=2341083 RepID=A0A498QL19_9MYCO|nr:hypothetical protein LAUMK13_05703 [Mycobacterium innocens]
MQTGHLAVGDDSGADFAAEHRAGHGMPGFMDAGGEVPPLAVCQVGACEGSPGLGLGHRVSFRVG